MNQKIEKRNILVLGMGASAFGRERRAASVSKYMKRVRAYFLISQWEDGSVSRLLREENIEFAFAPFGYLGLARLDWTLITLSHLPKLCYRVFKAYFENRCQAILFLCIHPFVNAFLVVLFLRLFFGTRLICYFGDIPRRTAFYRLAARLMDWLCSAFIANSLAVKRGLAVLGIPETRIEVIYNGLNVETYEQTVEKDLRRQFNWPEDCVLIGFIGQINEKKGVMDFVEAARIVAREESHCRFLMIGRMACEEIVLERKVKQAIRDYGLEDFVVFAGWKDGMEGIYKTLDIVVIPSRHEDPAPNVSIEAMASGIPIVATRVGGMPELVEDRVTGILVQKQDVQELTSRILELVRNPSLGKKMGEAGKKRARNLFNIQRNAPLVEEILFNGSL